MDLMVYFILCVVAGGIVYMIFNDRPKETETEKQLKKNAQDIINKKPSASSNTPAAWPFPVTDSQPVAKTTAKKKPTTSKKKSTTKTTKKKPVNKAKNNP